MEPQKEVEPVCIETGDGSRGTHHEIGVVKKEQVEQEGRNVVRPKKEDALEEATDADIRVPPRVKIEDISDESEDSYIEISDDDPPVPRGRKAQSSNGKGKQSRPRKQARSKVGRPRQSPVQQYPTFKLRVQPRHLTHNNVLVPYRVVRWNLPRTIGEVTLRVGSGEWKVRFIRFTSNKTGRLSVGWVDFAEANSLKVGDVCVFKLVQVAVFHVSINDEDA